MLHLCSIYWDPQPEVFRIPWFNWPVFWYGLLFSLGFIVGFPLFVQILKRFLGGEKKRCTRIADQLMFYMVLGTVVGARLGHFLFYENPAQYLKNPLDLLRIWEGGLASHGGALGIMLALVFFSYRIRCTEPTLGWIKLLDLVSIPAALGATFIRLGNFVNQEILGTETQLPWGVVFGHPADGSAPCPRHPVQIYEALFYFGLFLFLWSLSKKESFLKARGKFIGIFLTSVFTFRFIVEFFKLEQSHFLSHPTFTMGQILSVPLIAVGLAFYFAPHFLTKSRHHG